MKISVELQGDNGPELARLCRIIADRLEAGEVNGVEIGDPDAGQGGFSFQPAYERLLALVAQADAPVQKGGLPGWNLDNFNGIYHLFTNLETAACGRMWSGGTLCRRRRDSKGNCPKCVAALKQVKGDAAWL